MKIKNSFTCHKEIFESPLPAKADKQPNAKNNIDQNGNDVHDHICISRDDLKNRIHKVGGSRDGDESKENLSRACEVLLQGEPVHGKRGKVENFNQCRHHVIVIEAVSGSNHFKGQLDEDTVKPTKD